MASPGSAEDNVDAFGSFSVSAYDTTPEIVLGSDTFETNNFVFYPNPVKDVLNLSLNQEITNVTVLNLLGQQVINQSSNDKQVKIDMSGLSEGAYLVKVISGNQSKMIKVIKK